MYTKFNPSTLLPMGLLVAGALSSPLQHQNVIASSQEPLAGGIDNDAYLIHASKPPVTADLLAAKMSVKNLMARAEDLYKIANLSDAEYNHPTRVIGSLGHWGTINYVKKVLGSLGGYYTFDEQVFPAVSGNVFESRLTIDKHVVHALPMSLTPPTKAREPVFGKVVASKNQGCDESDFGDDVKGAIVLIKRGSCSFGTKSENAGKAGAIAAVVYNNEKGLMSGTLGNPTKNQVATFGISDEDGKFFLDELEKGESLEGSAYMDAIVEIIHTKNIVAQTILGDPDNCVMLGGHSDSVEEGPGINDDGSGSLTLVELAVQLSDFSVNNCVRIAWWAGEEEGLLGSTWYAEHLPETENQKIRLFMDYDMLASPNFAYQIYNATNSENPEGSEELRDLYIKLYSDLGVNHTFIPFDGRSDYVGFIEAGIPAGGIATGAEGVKTEEEVEMFGGEAHEWYDHCYHQLCDDVSNVNETAWLVNAKLVASSVGTYAESFEGFPKRKAESETVKAERKEASKQWKYRGNKLVM